MGYEHLPVRPKGRRQAQSQLERPVLPGGGRTALPPPAPSLISRHRLHLRHRSRTRHDLLIQSGNVPPQEETGSGRTLFTGLTPISLSDFVSTNLVANKLCLTKTSPLNLKILINSLFRLFSVLAPFFYTSYRIPLLFPLSSFLYYSNSRHIPPSLPPPVPSLLLFPPSLPPPVSSLSPSSCFAGVSSGLQLICHSI